MYIIFFIHFKSNSPYYYFDYENKLCSYNLGYFKTRNRHQKFKCVSSNVLEYQYAILKSNDKKAAILNWLR